MKKYYVFTGECPYNKDCQVKKRKLKRKKRMQLILPFTLSTLVILSLLAGCSSSTAENPYYNEEAVNLLCKANIQLTDVVNFQSQLLEDCRGLQNGTIPRLEPFNGCLR